MTSRQTDHNRQKWTDGQTGKKHKQTYRHTRIQTASKTGRQAGRNTDTHWQAGKQTDSQAGR